MNKVTVVIATSNNRTELLINRSLLSVYEQKNISPERVQVLIVDDNQAINKKYSSEYENIRNGIENLRRQKSLKKNEFPTILLTNLRTKHHSGTGAWNTAIYSSYSQEHRFISILDDDDEYMENHLSQCLKIAEKNPQALAIFQRLVWKTNNDYNTIELTKKKLTAEAFFIGNPGVQGSNMFICRNILLEIGAFDESLPNTTDRDIMIRFLRHLEKHSVMDHVFVIEKPGVIHHNHGQIRVNTNFKKKKIGLDLFYRKYKSQFSPLAFQKSLLRAKRYFQYEP